MLVFGSCGNKVFDLLSVCWVRGSGDYDRKKKDTVVCLTGCAVVLFFVVAGNFDYDRKKKDTVVCLRWLMCVFLYNPTLFYSVSLIYFFRAATAFDIFGTDNAEELLTCGFQYPSLPISILHFVARIFGRK